MIWKNASTISRGLFSYHFIPIKSFIFTEYCDCLQTWWWGEQSFSRFVVGNHGYHSHKLQKTQRTWRLHIQHGRSKGTGKFFKEQIELAHWFAHIWRKKPWFYWLFSIRSSSFQQLGTLREQAKAITNMAATVPYRMPGDVSSRLVQTEILMH